MCQHFEILLRKQGSGSPMGLLENDAKCFLKYLESKCGSGYMPDNGSWPWFLKPIFFLIYPVLCLIASRFW